MHNSGSQWGAPKMLCVTYAGSESLASDSCNRFYIRLDVAALASSPITKIDLGCARRLASKKHCNQSPSAPLCLRQESNDNGNGNVNGHGISPSVAGMWHRGAKAQAWSRSPGLILEPFNRSSEKTLDVLKPSQKTLDVLNPSQKTLDVVNPSQKNLKVHFSGIMPSEQIFEGQLTVIKPSGQTLEAQFKPCEQTPEARVSGFKTAEHTSEAPLNKLSEEPREAPIFYTNVRQKTQKAPPTLSGFEQSKHTLQGQCTRIEPTEKTLDHQSTRINTSAQTVEPRYTGIMPSEQILEAEYKYNGIKSSQEAWIRPSQRTQKAPSNRIRVSNPSLNAGLNARWQGNKSVINGTYFHIQRHGAQHVDMKEDQVHRNGHVVNGFQSFKQMHDATQHSHMEDQVRGYEYVVNGSHSYRQRNGATHLDIEGQVLGSKSAINGSHSQRQWHVTQHPGVEEQVLQELNSKEPITVSVVSRPINKVAAIRMPAYRTPFSQSSLRFRESILYLESIGADCSRLIREDPTAVICDAKRLRELVCALELYGLKWNDLGRIFNLCPKILHLSPEKDLKLVTSFLFDEVGLSPQDFSKVIRRCPRLLACEVNEQLWPTLRFLRTLGFSKMGQVVCNNATLLSFSVEKKLVPKLRYLESLGFTYREAVSMVVRFPAIFNYSAKENLQPKYDYLLHEMGGKNKDLLAFPQYFGYSLEKRIRPRHQCIVKQDVSLSIQAMLKLSEAEFNANFQCVGGPSHLPKDAFVLQETSDAKCHDCALESLKFVSFNHPGTPVLVGA